VSRTVCQPEFWARLPFAGGTGDFLLELLERAGCRVGGPGGCCLVGGDGRGKVRFTSRAFGTK